MPRTRVYLAALTAVMVLLCVASMRAEAEPTLSLSIDVGVWSQIQDVAVLDAPAVQRLYSTNFGTSSINIITMGIPATPTLTLNGGAASPYGVAVYNDALSPKVYVTNRTHGTVSVIDASGGTDVEDDNIGVNGGPMGVAVMTYGTPSHKVYVANNLANTVSMINGDTHAVTTLGNVTGPYGVAVNSVTQKVYVTNAGSNDITIFNATNDSLIKRYVVGSTPHGIAVDEANNRIYIACFGANRIYVLDGTTDTLVDQRIVTGGVEDIEILPDAGLIYVTVPANDEVRIFKTSAGMPEVAGSPLAVDSGPQGIATGPNLGMDPWYLFLAARDAGRIDLLEETDSYPPDFNGLNSAADGEEPLSGNGPTMVLNWDEASDISTPITYNVYLSNIPGGQDFGSPPAFSTAAFGTVTFFAGLQYATSYYVVVRAVDNSSVGAMDTNTVEKFVTLTDGAAPTGGVLTSAVDTGIGGQAALTWSAAVDDTPPITYNIYLGASTGSMTLATSVTGTTTKTLTGLTNDSLYYFNVRAEDGAGIESTNTTYFWTTPTDITPPVFAGLISAVNGGSGGMVTLSWNPATDASGGIMYDIYAEAGATVTFSTAVFSVSSSPYNLTGLTNGTQYTFGVRARDAYDNQDGNTAGFSAIPTDVLPPTFSGVNICADPGTDGQVRLLWAAAGDSSTPIYYNVYQATASGTQNFASWDYQFTATTSVYLTGLTNGTDYYYVVRAEDSATPPNEDPNLVQCMVRPTDGAAPVFNGVTSATATGNTGEIKLDWTAATDSSSPISYNIYQAATSGGQNFSSWTYQTTATTTYTVTGLTDGQMYYFVVRAQDPSQLQENNTVEKSAKPNDGTPPVFGGLTGLTNTTTSGSLNLSWSAAADPATPITYEVFAATTSGGQNFSAPSQATAATTTILTGLANNIPYYVVVRARDAGGVTDTNTTQMAATPTDQTAPVFGGITSAVDKQTGGVVELNWSPASDPSLPITYHIYQRIPPAAHTWVAVATSQFRPVQITGLTSGTGYAFSVGVQDGASPTTNMATNAIELFATPTDLTAPAFAGLKTLTDAQTSGSLNLTWVAATDNSGIDHYDIYYATSPDNFWITPKTTAPGTAASATLSGLINGTLYYVGVRAVDASPASNKDTNTARIYAVPSDKTAPVFGGITGATDTTLGSQVQLSWAAASDPSTPITYNIYYAVGATPSLSTPITSTSSLTGTTITGLTNGLPYHFVVRAKDSFNNESTNMQLLVATPTDLIQPAFAGLATATDTHAGGAVALTWLAASDNSQPVTYNIYEATTSGGQNFSTPSYTTQSVSYTITGLINGTTYYYVVRARDASTGGNEESNLVERSATPEDTTKPAFTGLTSAVDTQTGNSVILTWSAASDNSPPITYNIYQSSYAGYENYSSPSFSTQSTTMTITGLVDGARYFFVVRARDSAAVPNEDTNVVEREVRPSDKLAPSAPSSITANTGDITGDPGDEYVTVSWIAPTISVTGIPLDDLKGFNVFRSQVSGQPPSTPQNALDGIDNDGDGFIDSNDSNGDLIPATATQYVDTTAIISGTRYYYVVTSLDEAKNQSPLSDEKSAVPLNADDATPMPPDNLVAAPGDAQVTLTWIAPLVNTDQSTITDLQGYNIYRSTTTGSNYTLINASIVAALTYTDTSLTNGTTYYYVVTALDSATPPNESANSAETAVTPNEVGQLPPSAPTNLVVTSVDSAASLSWAAPNTNSDGSPLQDLAGYNIYRSTDSVSGFAMINAATVTILTYSDLGLTNGVTYFYYVTAIDTDGLESASSPQAFALYGSNGIQGVLEEYDASGGVSIEGYPKVGIPGMTIQLLNSANSVIASGITDGSGNFKIVYDNGTPTALFKIRLIVPESSMYPHDDDFIENGHGYFVLLKDFTIGTGFKTVKPTVMGKGPTGGDSNCDGVMDIVDFVNLKNAYGLSIGQTGYTQNLDFNGDTAIDVADFIILKKTYGKSSITPPTGLCISQ